MTLRELLQEATRLLALAEVEIPEQTARWIWQHVSGMAAHQMILEQQREVDVSQAAKFWELIRRRKGREPLQYILNEAEFAGLMFYVDHRVLVPRPETEGLVELAQADIKRRRQAHPDREITVMDLGTGSGAIAVAIAVAWKEDPNVHVIATDLSSDALDVARENANRHGVGERIDFRQGDGFAALRKGTISDEALISGAGKIDLLLSNPPYIPTIDAPILQPEVKDFEPHLALFAGKDGLDAYRMLADSAGDYLAQDATIMLEVGAGQAELVEGIFRTAFPAAISSIFADEQGILRIVKIQL